MKFIEKYVYFLYCLSFDDFTHNGSRGNTDGTSSGTIAYIRNDVIFYIYIYCQRVTAKWIITLGCACVFVECTKILWILKGCEKIKVSVSIRFPSFVLLLLNEWRNSSNQPF